MKKKKRNFITKIFSLLFLGIISITLLGSWTYNPSTDTITSNNIWNEKWELGGLNASNGEFGETNTSIRSKDYISIIPNTTYYCYAPITYTNGRIALYDNNYNYLGDNPNGWKLLPNNDTFTTSSNAYYIRFKFDATTYNNDIMINVSDVRINGTYEPYGTYVNKKEYDSVVEAWESVTEDYNTMVQEYDELNQEFQSLQLSYNEVEDRLSTLTDEYDTLLVEYQDLQLQYNDLLQQYNNVKNYTSDIYSLFNGVVVYLFYDSQVRDIAYYYNHLENYNLKATISLNDRFIQSFTYGDLPLSITNAIEDSDVSDNYRVLLFDFSEIYLNGKYFVVCNDFTYDFNISLYNSFTNNQLSINLTDMPVHNNVLTFDTDYNSFNFMQTDFTIDYRFTSIYTSSYTDAYNLGFQNGADSNYLEIANLKSNIKTLTQTIEQKNELINSLQYQIDNTLGWKPFFFAMADTPFKVVSNILGFEVFGVNLFKVFVGIITALAIIWLLKKLLGK